MLRGRDLIWMAERMQEKDRLWDIGEIDVDPTMEMQDKAEVFSEQIESNSDQDDTELVHRNGEYVVRVHFSDSDYTATDALKHYLRQMMKAGC